MATTVLLMAAVAVAVLAWSAAQGAVERARAVAASVCRAARVQLLDETVSLEKLALRRNRDGRLRLLRQYRYEYSRDGLERQPAALALLGGELLWVQGPASVEP